MTLARLPRRALLLLVLALVAGPLSVLSAPAEEPPSTVKAYLLSRPVAIFAPGVEDALAAAAPDEAVEVLVQFNDLEVADSDVALLRGLGFGNVVRYDILPILATAGTPEMIRALSQSSRVRRIELNKKLEYHLERSTKAVKADEGAWDRYVKDGNRIGLPVTGEGVTVAVLDSGVDGLHPDLRMGAKTVANKKFIGQSILGLTGPNEPHGEEFNAIGLWADVPNSDVTSVHGTHVAGIAAGNGSASTGSVAVGYGDPDATSRRGVAPGAKIFGIGAGDTIFVLNALAGFDLVYDQLRSGNPFNIRVINNSWGGDGEFDPDAFISQAVMILSYDMDRYAPAGKKLNQHIVFSAGNDGPDFGTTNLWGNIPATVSVANVSANGYAPNDVADATTAVASDSSRGALGRAETFPDLSAPGTFIRSTTAHANAALPYVPLHGTSMAAPHVAGGIALLLQANPNLGLAGVADEFSAGAPAQYTNPFLNQITEAEWILKATARHVTGSFNRVTGSAYLPAGTQTSPHDGYGIIDLEKAVGVALALNKLRQTNPSATIPQAIAAASAPGFIANVAETHNASNDLSTGWSGTSMTWGTPALWINSKYRLTVPPNSAGPWSLKLTLRWKQAGDLMLRMGYPVGTAVTSATLTSVAAPTTDGVKTVTITNTACPAGVTCTNYASAVKGDPARPWEFHVLTHTGIAALIDWTVTAELTHSGTWNPGRNRTTSADNTPDTFQRWGDWYDAENGSGPGHLESDAPAQHTIQMRYYDLGSLPTLSWSAPGMAPGGSSKFDAYADPAAPLPTKTVRLTREAWTAWHTSSTTPPPNPTVLTYSGATSGQYSDNASMSATLTYLGAPLSGQTVQFTLGAQSVSALTNAAGVASIPMRLLQVPGPYTLIASFAGASPAPPASTSTAFTVTKENTTLALTVTGVGSSADLRARLADADTPASGIISRNVLFTQGTFTHGTSVTNTDGVARRLDSAPVRSRGGYSASFAGDAYYLASSAGPVPLTAPPAPVITAPASGSAFTTCTINVTGTAEPGSTVRLYDGATEVAVTTAAGDGSWSASLCLADGSHVLTATASDGADVSPPSLPVSILIDTTAPLAPVILEPCGVTLTRNNATMSGTGEPGTRIRVTMTTPAETVTLSGGTVAGDGTWSAPVIFNVNGPHTLTAVAVDGAGNIGAPSAPCSFIVDADLTGPSAPVITAPADGARTAGSLVVSGTASADTDVVSLYDGVVLTATVPASGGTWSAPVDLTTGYHTLTAIAFDAAGNASPRSAAVVILVDGDAPTIVINRPPHGTLVQPVLPLDAYRRIRGSATDGHTGVARVELVYEPLLPLLGTAHTTPNACAACPAAEGKTVTWSDRPNLAPGVYVLTATAFDRVGNVASKEAILLYVMQ